MENSNHVLRCIFYAHETNSWTSPEKAERETAFDTVVAWAAKGWEYKMVSAVPNMPEELKHRTDVIKYSVKKNDQRYYVLFIPPITGPRTRYGARRMGD